MTGVLAADDGTNSPADGMRQRPQQQQQQQQQLTAPPETTLPTPTMMKSRSRMRLPEDLTSSQEMVFLNMQLRKMNRALTGTKSRNKSYEFVALAVLLVIIYSVGTNAKEVDGQPIPGHEPFVSLNLNEVIMIGVWLYLAVFITETFKESRFIELLYWMIIYLPLLAMTVAFLFGGESSGELGYFDNGEIIGILLAVVELLSVAIFVGIYVLYPKMLNSEWFRRKHRVALYWKVNTVADWTMTYRKFKSLTRKRYTCKYEGETNDKGEPHGLGRWYDDAFDGEVLTGTWKDGLPVAPFYSRHYGKGDTFSAVRIAYVMASDDEFEATKFWPTNETPPRCGVASVECSVSGAFYNELPSAEHFVNPYLFDAKTSVEELCRNLAHTSLEEEINMIQIKTAGSHGVNVKGHVHAATGKHFNDDVDEIVIRVKRNTAAIVGPMQFMPRQRKLSNLPERIVLSDPDLSSAISATRQPETKGDEETAELSIEQILSRAEQTVSLSVENWLCTKRKEALVFIPGFNCCLKDALQNFGQLMAMTKLDAHVYPILYGWPCGQVLSYHSASRTSQNEQNRENFLQLMKGLQNAGITNVHLMSHSMGVQTLLSAFCDKSDGSRGDVSRCFHLASRQRDKINPKEEGSNDDEELLVCKTMTMLNPDFPLEAFVDHGFRSIRKICDTITIVGDKNDGALFWSQAVNGIAVCAAGYKQPENLEPNENNKHHLRYQSVIGKSIESLHLPESLSNERALHGHLVFQDRAPLVLVTDEDEDLEKLWLDLDVIDTTGLDTNIADIRHSAYNLNPILLNDLEELITTGQRAMKRSSLLYRDGNIFSYCHAPSYVSF